MRTFCSAHVCQLVAKDITSKYTQVIQERQIQTNSQNAIANELRLSREVWEFIGEYASAFEPLIMQDFQRVDYTMSDFYLR